MAIDDSHSPRDDLGATPHAAPPLAPEFTYELRGTHELDSTLLLALHDFVITQKNGGLADRAARAGSCIFIHVRRPDAKGTAGCVALPEPQVEALQDFAEGGAVLAVLPRQALDRFKGCLP